MPRVAGIRVQEQQGNQGPEEKAIIESRRKPGTLGHWKCIPVRPGARGAGCRMDQVLSRRLCSCRFAKPGTRKDWRRILVAPSAPAEATVLRRRLLRTIANEPQHAVATRSLQEKAIGCSSRIVKPG